MTGGYRAVLREPLLHFLVLGVLIFGAYSLLDDRPPPVASNEIVVSDDDARRLLQQFEATWRRPPQPDELDNLIGQYIREEVYVREALALGLDRDDAVVRQRLQQKMVFLTESGAEAVEPTENVLEAHLAANRDRFERSPLVAFEQVPMRAGAGADEIAAALAALREGAARDGVGMPSLLPRAFRPSPRVVVDGTFGEGFFERVSSLEPGGWVGPVASGYGPHLVRVDEAIPGRLPALDEIRDEVERDWRASVRERLKDERYEALRSRYEIRRPDPEEVLAQ